MAFAEAHSSKGFRTISRGLFDNACKPISAMYAQEALLAGCRPGPLGQLGCLDLQPEKRKSRKSRTGVGVSDLVMT